MPSKNVKRANAKVKVKNRKNKLEDSPVLVSDENDTKETNEPEEKKENELVPE